MPINTYLFTIIYYLQCFCNRMINIFIANCVRLSMTGDTFSQKMLSRISQIIILQEPKAANEFPLQLWYRMILLVTDCLSGQSLNARVLFSAPRIYSSTSSSGSSAPTFFTSTPSSIFSSLAFKVIISVHCLAPSFFLRIGALCFSVCSGSSMSPPAIFPMLHPQTLKDAPSSLSRVYVIILR